MGFKGILKGIGKGVSIGGYLGLPGIAQADAVIDAIKASKASTAEKAALTAQVEFLKATSGTPADIPKGFLEGNRTRMLMLGIAAVVLVKLGLSEAAAQELVQWIAALVGAGIAGETLRPSTKAQ
jgi:thioredoxin-like negative regulator of GroEL